MKSPRHEPLDFVNRSKIAMYEKGLAVELTPLLGAGLKSPEYQAIQRATIEKLRKTGTPS